MSAPSCSGLSAAEAPDRRNARKPTPRTRLNSWPIFFAVALLLFLAVACGDDVTDPGPIPAAVDAVSQPDPTTVGSPVVLGIRVTDAEGNAVGGVTTNWEIVSGGGTLSANSVQTGPDGLAEAIWTVGTAAGQGQVRAQVEGLPAVTFSITIEPGAAAGVSASPESILLDAIEATETIEAAAVDEHGNEIDATLDWSTLDADVATVSSEGEVTAQGEGSTSVVITAGEVSETVEVEVIQVAATFDIEQTLVELTRIGEERQLAAVAADANGHPIVRELDYDWTSSDPSVATVDEAGVVTAVGIGQGTISATLPGVTGTASTDVTVTQFLQVTASFSHACAIRADGQAFCWGRNSGGKLGDGSEEMRYEPVAVLGGLELTAITSGGRHTCGLTPGGAAYCWGTGGNNQLGTGSDDDSSTPVPVAGGHTFTSISAGNFHTCALTADNQAYCWGHNSSGQAGAGHTDDTPQPVAVVGEHAFEMIAAGGNHTCGMTVHGEAYCWGAGTSGQLGDGQEESTDTPVLVAGGHTFKHLNTSQHFSCGVATTGQTYCWGRGTSGELGSGATDSSPTPVLVSTAEEFATVDLGPDRACAMTTTGTAYCWGGALLGDGSSDSSPLPVAVSDGLLFDQVKRGRVGCGVTTEGEVYCWGHGSRGRLGIGTTDDHATPVRINTPAW